MMKLGDPQSPEMLSYFYNPCPEFLTSILIVTPSFDEMPRAYGLAL
jgi:hypothetical protein